MEESQSINPTSREGKRERKRQEKKKSESSESESESGSGRKVESLHSKAEGGGLLCCFPLLAHIQVTFEFFPSLFFFFAFDIQPVVGFSAWLLEDFVGAWRGRLELDQCQWRGGSRVCFFVAGFCGGK